MNKCKTYKHSYFFFKKIFIYLYVFLILFFQVKKEGEIDPQTGEKARQKWRVIRMENVYRKNYPYVGKKKHLFLMIFNF